MKKLIVFVLLIMFSASYACLILASEVPPAPQPPGPTGPGPGTGRSHDQPFVGPKVEQLEEFKEQLPNLNDYNIFRKFIHGGIIGIFSYLNPIFSIGNNAVRYRSKICQNDEVDIGLKLRWEWARKGGRADSPPVYLYDMSIDEMIKKLKDKTLTPPPILFRSPFFILQPSEDSLPAGNIICSKDCRDILKINTEQPGPVNFNFNCIFECIIFTVKGVGMSDDELQRYKYTASLIEIISPIFMDPNDPKIQIDNIYLLLFNITNIRGKLTTPSTQFKVDFSTSFDVVPTNTETSKLSFVSYSYNMGFLTAQIKNEGNTLILIDKVEFDKDIGWSQVPKYINAGQISYFVVYINEGKTKMDIYLRTEEKACNSGTNYQATYELNLVKRTREGKPLSELQTEKPKANPDITQPIVYGISLCDKAAEVKNLKIDVGGFGVSQYRVETLKDSITINDPRIMKAVNDYLKNCYSDDCIVPIKISADNDFKLNVKDIKVTYK